MYWYSLSSKTSFGKSISTSVSLINSSLLIFLLTIALSVNPRGSSFLGPNEPYRSIPLDCFKKILSLNANFYALQNEVWDRDLEYFKSSNLIDCGNYKLDELSSLISKLDLVITCDTSLLHLASSLNIETWGILCLYPDWRWGEFNKFNPYNKLKLFNQKQFCNWDFINDEVYELLKKKLN